MIVRCCNKAATYTGQRTLETDIHGSSGILHTTPVVERSKTCHASDNAATAVVFFSLEGRKYILFFCG
jgi:hypothetical protein